MSSKCYINHRVFGIFAIGFSLVCAAMCSGFQFSITSGSFPVLDGSKQATIVYNPSGTEYEIKAYQDLERYLEKATGRDFVVMTETAFNSSSAKFPIYVGNCTATQQAIGTQLTSVDRDGFMIVVESKRMFLAGPKDYSTYWAVLQFLEDYVGVRWLLPGNLGDDVLPQSKIVITPVRRVEEPKISSREMYGVQSWHVGGPEWLLRQKLRARYQYSHNIHSLYPPTTYCSTHPEYYTWYNGARYCGSGWDVHICFTEPGVVPAAVQTVRNYFNSNYNEESYSFGQDDATKWCQCSPTSPSPATHSSPYCSQLFINEPYPNTEYFKIWGSDTRAAKLYYYWLNQVAQQIEITHPTKICGTLAYGGNTCPPLDTVVPYHNIMPYICCTLADTYTPDYGNQVRWLMDSWSSKVDRIGLYDYAYGHGNVLPRIYTKQVQKMIKYGYEHKLDGVTGEFYPNWGLDGPRLYQTARIWWNPYVDINDIFNDWNERMFKEAAGPMKSFFSRCEEAWLACDSHIREPYVKHVGAMGTWKVSGYPVFAQGWRTSPYEIYTPTLIAELTGYLDQAAAIAVTQIAKDRIQFYRKTWDLGMEFTNAYWSGEGADLLVARGTTLLELVASLKKMPPTYDMSYFMGQISSRIGTDYVAFYPVTEDWLAINNQTKAANASTYQWCAQQIVQEQINAGCSYSLLGQCVDSRVTELFGSTGNALYLSAVADIRAKAAAVVASTPPYGPETLVWYKLSDRARNTATNFSDAGSAYNGTFNPPGAAWLWVTADPKFGDTWVLSFDGTNGAITVPSAALASLNNAITITLWQKGSSGAQCDIFEAKKTDNSVTIGSKLPWLNGGNNYVTWDAGSPLDSISKIASASNYTGQWNHWAFTKNASSGQQKIYLNGTLWHSGTGKTASMSGTASMQIGLGANGAYSGWIRDFRIYDSELGSADIAGIYAE